MTDIKKYCYSGSENLEIMAEAINYNAFLLETISEHCNRAINIVDFGAGIGTFAKPLQSDTRNIIAVEPDEIQCLQLEAAGITCFRDLALVDDGWADAIYSINVLEHINHDQAALNMLFSKLKPAGKLLIYVPAFQVLYSSMDKKVGHFRRYKRRDLQQKLQDAGFSILDSHYVDSLGFIATLVFKLFGNDSGDINKNSLKLFDRIIFPVSRLLDCVASAWFGKNLIAIAEKKQK